MRDPANRMLEALGVPIDECLWLGREDGSVTVITDEGAFDVPPEGVLAIPPVAGWHGDD